MPLVQEETLMSAINTIRFKTLGMIFFCWFMESAVQSFAQYEPSPLLQILDPEEYDWKLNENTKDIRFLKIDESIDNKEIKSVNIKALNSLINRTTTLTSLWIPGRFLSNELVTDLSKQVNLRTLVIIDALDSATLIKEIEKSKSLELVVLVRNRTSFVSPVAKGKTIAEVDMFENSPYLNANGCPTSDFLKKHFGAKFKEKTPRKEEEKSSQ